MKLVSFIFFVSWILPAVQSHEDGGNLRASQGQMQEHYQQKLDQSIRNLNEEFQGDRELLWGRISEFLVCRRIEKALSDNVACECDFKLFHGQQYAFKCLGTDNFNLAFFKGVPEYSGTIDIDLFHFNFDISAKVCIKDGRFFSISFRELCISGSLCAGGLHPHDIDVCGCAVTYGNATCECGYCGDGGVIFNCTGLPHDLPSICIPLPFLRTFRPMRESIPGTDSWELI
jgi:hypothetical protein